MAKVGSYYWSVSDTTAVAAVGTAFDGAKKTSLSLGSVLTPDRTGKQWSGKIEGIVIHVSAIAGGATKITMRGILSGTTALPDTEANIALDVGSAVAGTVAFYAGLGIMSPTDTLEIFCHTDAGTVTVDSVVVSWSE